MAGRGVSAPFLLRLDRMFASARFQALAARLPIGRGFARRDGAAIFDVLQGFVASQVLAALVDLGLLRRLLDEPARAERLAISLALPLERLEVLLRAAVALKLLKRRRDGRYSLARRGAAIVGVPGLEAMIAHNAAFYADMADPVALMKGGGETHLARFWPYVQGEVGQAEAGRYSDLMAQSQRLVAQDTLAQVSLKGRRRLMDVGGGTGAFMAEALTVWPELEGALLDLPEVLSAARSRLSGSGLEHRVSLKPQSFREATLPTGADVISLVRVLYDHDDETVVALLSRCFAALPPGGMLLVSEPMSGGAHPDRTTDVYFAFYTMAMGTGRVRSAARIAEMCEDAGFSSVRAPRPRRPYITSVLTCVKPG